VLNQHIVHSYGMELYGLATHSYAVTRNCETPTHCHSKDLATHSLESHEIVYLTRKHNRTRKFEGIQMKSSSLSVHNEDDRRKITINDKHHSIGQ